MNPAADARAHPRVRRCVSVAAAIVALAVAGCATSTASGGPSVAAARAATRPSAAGAALEREVVELVNRHRGARGLPALRVDERIGRQARSHSVAMAAGAVPPGHAGFDDRSDTLRRLMSCRRSAENVAFNRGYRNAASEAMRGWLGSPGHRTNIEGPYDATGVGVASNARGEVYFTQIFVGACASPTRAPSNR